MRAILFAILVLAYQPAQAEEPVQQPAAALLQALLRRFVAGSPS